MSDFAKGERLRQLREDRHMSREDAAHEIGVSTRALYVWETKDGPIRWTNAQRAAAATATSSTASKQSSTRCCCLLARPKHSKKLSRSQPCPKRSMTAAAK